MKIDQIQQAAVRRAETYLRKKLQPQPRAAIGEWAKEVIATALFVACVIAAFICGLAL
jgi:hypothetical protein